MWAVMMVGMMTPSAAPMILIYARVGRQASAQGQPFAATGWFASGYLLTWVGFSLVATAVQWALERTALLDPKMASASQVFGGIVLIAAGVYQWTPLKNICLAQCQSPLLFIQRQGGFHRDPSSSLLLGLRHGAYCVGCCWVLMALLFVGGGAGISPILLSRMPNAGAAIAKNVLKQGLPKAFKTDNSFDPMDEDACYLEQIASQEPVSPSGDLAVDVCFA